MLYILHTNEYAKTVTGRVAVIAGIQRTGGRWKAWVKRTVNKAPEFREEIAEQK